MATVSLCMIVKNEEAVLARCLDSICAAVDEIIIVDTGSTDATKEIASRFTDLIFDFEWIDDFSAARNYSFSKATMEFILWLDADDVFTPKDREAFLALKNSSLDDTDVVMMRYNTAFDEEGKPVFTYYRERLIRRSIPFAWSGRVHEAIVHSGRTRYADHVAVTHRSVKSTYSDRNLRIYEKQAAEEELSARDQFYYGRELYYHKHYNRAKKVLIHFLSGQDGWLENNIEACKILSYCYMETDEPYYALGALLASFVLDEPRAEICCEIGLLFMYWQRYRIAVFWFELALALPRNDKSGAFISEDCHGYLPCIQLCVCYDHLGDFEKAREYNRRAGVYRPSSPAYLENVKYFDRIFENHR